MIQLGEEIQPPISAPMEWLGTSCDLFVCTFTKWRNWIVFFASLELPGGSDGEESAAVQENQVWSLGWEDPLEKGMATHSSIFAWRIPRTEEPGGLQPMGSQRATTEQLTFCLSLCSPKRVSALLDKVYLPMLCSHLSGLYLHLAWLIKAISQRRWNKTVKLPSLSHIRKKRSFCTSIML